MEKENIFPKLFDNPQGSNLKLKVIFSVLILSFHFDVIAGFRIGIDLRSHVSGVEGIWQQLNTKSTLYTPLSCMEFIKKVSKESKGYTALMKISGNKKKSMNLKRVLRKPPNEEEKTQIVKNLKAAYCFKLIGKTLLSTSQNLIKDPIYYTFPKMNPYYSNVPPELEELYFTTLTCDNLSSVPGVILSFAKHFMGRNLSKITHHYYKINREFLSEFNQYISALDKVLRSKSVGKKIYRRKKKKLKRILETNKKVLEYLHQVRWEQ